jgi:hypothetical protein
MTPSCFTSAALAMLDALNWRALRQAARGAGRENSMLDCVVEYDTVETQIVNKLCSSLRAFHMGGSGRLLTEPHALFLPWYNGPALAVITSHSGCSIRVPCTRATRSTFSKDYNSSPLRPTATLQWTARWTSGCSRERLLISKLGPLSAVLSPRYVLATLN